MMEEDNNAPLLQNVQDKVAVARRKYQSILDRWTPYMLNRWLTTGGLLCLFILRIVLAQGVRLIRCAFT